MFIRKHYLIFYLLVAINIVLFPQVQDSIKYKKTDMKLASFLLNKTGEIKTLPIPKSKIRIDGNDALSIIVKCKDAEALKSKGYLINSHFGDFVTMRIKPGDIVNLIGEESVVNVIPDRIYRPNNDIAAAVTGARLLNTGFLNNSVYTGKKVLLCFIDTGIDWSYPDFRSIRTCVK